MEKLLLEPEEAFEMLGVRRSKGYKMLLNGELPSIKIGRLRRVPLEELRKWIRARVHETAAQDARAPNGSEASG